MKWNNYKVYVPVSTDFDVDGRMLPRSITWEDGTTYDIDRVKSIRPGFAAKAGGQGDKYTILVNGRETNIFFERAATISGNVIGRWYVERKAPRA